MKFNIFLPLALSSFFVYFVLPACLGNLVSCFVLLLPFSFPRLQLYLPTKYTLQAYGTNRGLWCLFCLIHVIRINTSA